jgi:hypothetical protein
MITILSSALLALAAPAASSPAPATDPHANHAQHQGMDHSQHKAMHDCKKCCEDAKKTGAKMECGMDEKSGAKPAASPTS